MKFGKGPVCELKSLRNWASLCGILAVVLLLYYDPFLLLWWPQEPAESLPLNMATDSIDDMYDGCQFETASKIDLFGVYEWHFNKNFSFAWAHVERYAKKPKHKHLKEDHAIVLYMYTSIKNIQQDFNRAVKTGKHKYNTSRFRFHYLYFYLADAIQALRHNKTMCRTTYLRTKKLFDTNVINTKMRFGAFTWAASSKQSFSFNGEVSCFEIHSCFGADITHYSALRTAGQVLIPPYEVFTITDVLTDDPWCSVVYKLQSTKIPRGDLNCKLVQRQSQTYFAALSAHWRADSVGTMSVWLVLLILISVILVKRKEKCFVAAVLGTLLVTVLVMLSFRHSDG